MKKGKIVYDAFDLLSHMFSIVVRRRPVPGSHEGRLQLQSEQATTRRAAEGEAVSL